MDRAARTAAARTTRTPNICDDRAGELDRRRRPRSDSTRPQERRTTLRHRLPESRAARSASPARQDIRHVGRSSATRARAHLVHRSVRRCRSATIILPTPEAGFYSIERAAGKHRCSAAAPGTPEHFRVDRGSANACTESTDATHSPTFPSSSLVRTMYDARTGSPPQQSTSAQDREAEDKAREGDHSPAHGPLHRHDDVRLQRRRIGIPTAVHIGLFPSFGYHGTYRASANDPSTLVFRRSRCQLSSGRRHTRRRSDAATSLDSSWFAAFPAAAVFLGKAASACADNEPHAVSQVEISANALPGRLFGSGQSLIQQHSSDYQMTDCIHVGRGPDCCCQCLRRGGDFVDGWRSAHDDRSEDHRRREPRRSQQPYRRRGMTGTRTRDSDGDLGNDPDPSGRNGTQLQRTRDAGAASSPRHATRHGFGFPGPPAAGPSALVSFRSGQHRRVVEFAFFCDNVGIGPSGGHQVCRDRQARRFAPTASPPKWSSETRRCRRSCGLKAGTRPRCRRA